MLTVGAVGAVVRIDGTDLPGSDAVVMGPDDVRGIVSLGVDTIGDGGGREPSAA